MPDDTPDNETVTRDLDASFIYVICQNGAESAAKLEILTAHPNLRLAFSRPGFITFKVDADNPLPQKFSLKSTLARTYGWSLGKLKNEDANQMVAEIVESPQLKLSRGIHVWQRDPVLPGKNGFEPGVSSLAKEIGNLFSQTTIVQENEIAVNEIAGPNDLVFDIVLVEPDEWWYGFHFATTVAGRWPGGVPMIDTTVETFSRAYFKLKEALLWSGIRVNPGDQVAEIGSAPGGACQLLLEMGAHVIGIDPAEMESEILEHKNFTHIRRRGSEVKRRDFRNVRWLIADLNMDPDFTLDTIAEVVQHDLVDVKGVIMTLKFQDWKMVKKIPSYMARAKELGFQVVKSRQLAFNRGEFCLVAVKDKFLLRAGKRS